MMWDIMELIYLLVLPMTVRFSLERKLKLMCFKHRRSRSL